MTDVQKAMAEFVRKAFEQLDRISYYELLRLDREATTGEVKKTYYKYARRLHPDLYGRKIDPEFKRQLTAVYSRVVEAYQVLSDGQKRRLYDRVLRRGNVRLTADAEKKPRKRQDADRIRNPHAKKFYKLGVEALRKGDKKTAVTNLKLAFSAEPGSFVIKKALAEAKKK